MLDYRVYSSQRDVQVARRLAFALALSRSVFAFLAPRRALTAHLVIDVRLDAPFDSERVLWRGIALLVARGAPVARGAAGPHGKAPRTRAPPHLSRHRSRSTRLRVARPLRRSRPNSMIHQRAARCHCPRRRSPRSRWPARRALAGLRPSLRDERVAVASQTYCLQSDAISCKEHVRAGPYGARVRDLVLEAAVGEPRQIEAPPLPRLLQAQHEEATPTPRQAAQFDRVH